MYQCSLIRSLNVLENALQQVQGQHFGVMTPCQNVPDQEVSRQIEASSPNFSWEPLWEYSKFKRFLKNSGKNEGIWWRHKERRAKLCFSHESTLFCCNFFEKEVYLFYFGDIVTVTCIGSLYFPRILLFQMERGSFLLSGAISWTVRLKPKFEEREIGGWWPQRSILLS